MSVPIIFVGADALKTPSERDDAIAKLIGEEGGPLERVWPVISSSAGSDADATDDEEESGLTEGDAGEPGLWLATDAAGLSRAWVCTGLDGADARSPLVRRALAAAAGVVVSMTPGQSAEAALLVHRLRLDAASALTAVAFLASKHQAESRLPLLKCVFMLLRAEIPAAERAADDLEGFWADARRALTEAWPAGGSLCRLEEDLNDSWLSRSGVVGVSFDRAAAVRACDALFESMDPAAPAPALPSNSCSLRERRARQAADGVLSEFFDLVDEQVARGHWLHGADEVSSETRRAWAAVELERWRAAAVALATGLGSDPTTAPAAPWAEAELAKRLDAVDDRLAHSSAAAGAREAARRERAVDGALFVRSLSGSSRSEACVEQCAVAYASVATGASTEADAGACAHASPVECAGRVLAAWRLTGADLSRAADSVAAAGSLADELLHLQDLRQFQADEAVVTNFVMSAVDFITRSAGGDRDSVVASLAVLLRARLSEQERSGADADDASTREARVDSLVAAFRQRTDRVLPAPRFQLVSFRTSYDGKRSRFGRIFRAVASVAVGAVVAFAAPMALPSLGAVASGAVAGAAGSTASAAVAGARGKHLWRAGVRGGVLAGGAGVVGDCFGGIAGAQGVATRAVAEGVVGGCANAASGQGSFGSGFLASAVGEVGSSTGPALHLQRGWQTSAWSGASAAAAAAASGQRDAASLLAAAAQGVAVDRFNHAAHQTKDGPLPADALSVPELRDLYGQDISAAQYMRRPGSWFGKDGVGFHDGVLLTTASGEKWLLHHTTGHKPVLVRASSMGEGWRLKKDLPLAQGRRLTVADAVRTAGERPYNLLTWQHCLSMAHRVGNGLAAPDPPPSGQ